MKTKLLAILLLAFVFIIPFTSNSQITCLPPSGLTTTNITQTSAVISWTAPAGSLYFIVQYRPVTNPASSWMNLTAQTTSVTLPNLVCGHVYEWQVATICSNTSGGISSYAPVVTFSTQVCNSTCLPPTGLVTTNITLTGATLSWLAVANVQGYVVQYRPITNPASSWTTVNATTTSVSLTNLTCGTNYQWQVASYCGPGTVVLSPYSPPINFVTQNCTIPCSPPTALTTTNITQTGATLSWTAATGAVAYVVQYRPVTNPVSNWISLTTQTTSINLSNLTCGTVYEWQVASSCSNSSGSLSPFSAPYTFATLPCTSTCLPPVGLTVTNVSLTGATLSWNAATGAVAYLVQYRPVTNPASSWVSATTQNTSLNLSNLTCGTVYEWQVASSCSNSSGSLSPFSALSTFTTLPCTSTCPPPNGLATTNISLTSATLSWLSAGTAQGYVVQYRPVTNPASSWITVNATTTTINLTNLNCGTTYQWQVAKYCGPGNIVISVYSPPIYFSTLACIIPCAAPTGINTSNISQNSATLGWNAVSGAVAYLVQYRQVSNPVSSWTSFTTQSITANLSNLACGTYYEWQVASYCSNNTTPGSFSSVITFSTLACTSSCPPPTGLTTSNISISGATLSWTASAGALGYLLQYRPVTNPVSSWVAVNTQNTSVNLNSLNCGTTYEWRVASYCGNSSGNISPYSAPQTFNTLICLTPCLPPTGLIATNITTNGATLMWIASGGATSYVVQYRKIMNPAATWTTVSAQTNSLVLTNLNCGTGYQWRVARNCGTLNSQISNFSGIMTFTTLPCTGNSCLVPSGLTSSVLNTSPGSVILNWNATNAASYKIRYRKAGTAAYTLTTSSTNSKTLTGLSSGQYEWQVQSVCVSSSNLSLVSAWSVTAYFGISGMKAVFPNPLNGNDLYVPLQTEVETPLDIMIMDRYGRNVKAIKQVIIPGDEDLKLDVSFLRDGVYFIVISGENIHEYQKIIVKRD